MEKIYAAYGSNLNREEMQQRCPTARLMERGVLQGWKLAFRGFDGEAFATVEPVADEATPVLLWELQPTDEAALDLYEEYPGLYRKEMVAVNCSGKAVEAMVYVMLEGNPLGFPADEYYDIVRRGYEEAGFDLQILWQAIKK